eukprot:69320_1
MIIELDPQKSRDGVVICFIFSIINIVFCNDWQWWHIIFRFLWISFISGLIQFHYLPIVLKSMTVVRLLCTILLFGVSTTFTILLFVHEDIVSIVEENKSSNYKNTILNILMIDIQCSYMQTLCASLWYWVSLSKHFGYLNEWKFVLKTIIPHSLTLFVISLCPSLQIKYWWISLRLYSLLINITQSIFDQGFTSIFNTKRGQIGIKNSSLNPYKITSILSKNIITILNVLSILRHLYFMCFIAPWLMVIFMLNNIYAMIKQFLLKGRQHLQMSVVL